MLKVIISFVNIKRAPRKTFLGVVQDVSVGFAFHLSNEVVLWPTRGRITLRCAIEPRPATGSILDSCKGTYVR